MKENIIDEIIEFLEEDNTDALIDHVKEDLNIKNIDPELSKIYDMVEEKFYEVSLEDIIKAVLSRVIIAIETFKEI